MKIIYRVGILMPLLTSSLACWANGGPVNWTQDKPVGGIEPRQENTIELVREDLEITILDLNSYKVEANYLLKNQQGKKRLTYGVPLYWVEQFDPEKAASGINISVNKKKYNCHAENPTPRTGMEAQEISEMLGQIGDAWCVAEIEIPKGESVRLRLSYRADLEFEDWEFSKSAKTEFSVRKLKYPLSPAGYWNGKPELNVRLKLGPYAGHVSKFWPMWSEKSDEVVTWRSEDADLKKLGELRVEFNSETLLQHHQFATWNAEAHPAKKVSGKVTASSTLQHANNRYAADNMMDGDPSTAWCEGKEGDGVGESFTIQSEQNTAEHYCSGEGIVIVPGYAKTAKTYLDNGRISKLRVEECEDPSSYAELRWQPNENFNESSVFINTKYSTFIPRQYIEKTGGKWAEKAKSDSSTNPSCLRFIILETVPGKRFSDTCISEVAFVRNCG